MGKSHFIRYDGSENDKHRSAKNRLTFLLISKGWKLITNTVNGEFKLNPSQVYEHNYADYYHSAGEKEKRTYQLDCHMKAPNCKLYVFEFDGAYHFASRHQINKMHIRNAFIKGYFARRGLEIIIVHFTVEELHGRYAVDDDYILSEANKGIDRNIF